MLVIWMILLIIQAICDIKWKRIPLVLNMMGAALGLCYCILSQRAWIDILWGLVPGVVCLCYSIISRETLGLGDSLTMCALGLVIDIKHMLLIMMIAFGLAAFGGMFILVVFQKKRNYEIPFVPFLLMGFLIDVVIQIGGYCE